MKTRHLPEYRCRKLKKSDLESVMRWRMSPHVTQFMNTDPVLTIEGQEQWFNNLSSARELYWVIEVDGAPCGVINLANIDLSNKRCKWGYYVAEKKLRSIQLAVSLEMSLYDYAFDIIGLNKIVSESFLKNTVVKIHELCQCETEGILKQHILKNGQYYDVIIQSMLADKWRSIRDGFEYQKILFEG